MKHSYRPILLGVNIDHIATVRNARGTAFPDPVDAAFIAERAGADGITAHLREDRRHIRDEDIFRLKSMIHTRLNLEMAVTDEMLHIASEVKPAACCLVPEKREELTTEGGLDVVKHFDRVDEACDVLKAAGIAVSPFVDPDRRQIDAAAKAGASMVEIHTGTYADAENELERRQAFLDIQQAAEHAHAIGIHVNAGHGLNYHNVEAICCVPQIIELNIGHALIARAVLVGLEAAVKDMKQSMQMARAASTNPQP